MAIIKMINSKTKQTRYGLNRVINYVQKMKDQGGLIEGINCNADTAFDQFWLTKELANKISGRLYIHMEQSFPKDAAITPEQSLDIGKELINELPEIFEGFQIVLGVHTDKDHIHNHFAINSVNSITEKKWNLSKNQKEMITQKSLELCDRHGIKIWWDKERYPEEDKNKNNKLNTSKQGEYEKQKEGKSWKYELFLSISTCLKISRSREEFIKNMGELNYQVQWDYHKYIVFTTPDGKKCRNNKLYPTDRFTKENLEKIFERNLKRSINEKEHAESNKEFGEIKKVIQAFYFGAKGSTQPNDGELPITGFKRKKLEGQALKELAIKKANAGYNWENDWEM